MKDILRVTWGLIRNTSWEFALVKSDKNIWLYPWGKVNKDESYEDATRRELYEELWMQEAKLWEKNEFSHLLSHDGKPMIFVVYEILWLYTIKDLKPGWEIQEVKFYTLDEIERLDSIAPATKETLNSILLKSTND